MLHRQRPSVKGVRCLVLAGLLGCGSDKDDGPIRDAALDARAPVDGAGRAEAGRRGDGAAPDARVLLPCAEPGRMGCETDDPCAITSECGEDRFCHVLSRQNCDDGLACTDDVCLRRGLCDHVVTFGSCFIPALLADSPRCVAEEGVNPDNPCQRCRPNVNRVGWTEVSGVTCDDGDPCTDSDKCRDGLCRGDYFGFECADAFDCTVDRCLGKNERVDGTRCALDHPIVAGWCKAPDVQSPGAPLKCFAEGDVSADGCLVCAPERNSEQLTDLRASPGTYCSVDNQCYADGSTDPSGCWVCDVDVASDRLSRASDVCEIDGRCYADGAAHPSGCGVCDVSANRWGWTVSSGGCLIDGACRAAGVDNDWCQVCEPESSTASWSLVPDACLVEGRCRAKGETPGSTGALSCAVCSPSRNARAWSAQPGTCLIDETCHASGARAGADRSGGCAECAPAESWSRWTLDPGWCLIDGRCLQPGQDISYTSSCLVCDADSRTDWADAAEVVRRDYSFEEGLLPPGWSITGAHKQVRWQVSSRRSFGDGHYALYYGHPSRGDTSTGADNQGRVSFGPLTLARAKGALLQFRLYWSVGRYDRLKVMNGGSTIRSFGASDYAANRWHRVLVDLRNYTFSTLNLAFEFQADASDSRGEGVYIDDVRLYDDC